MSQASKSAPIFPGQGAQVVGMGSDFYDSFPIAREVFQEADEQLGYSLSRIIFTGPPEELTRTDYCQLALYVTSMAMLRVVQSQFPSLAWQACGGLSLGEYTAMTAAGKWDFLTGLELVRIRGEAMHRACKMTRGGMAAVIGLEVHQVEASLAYLQREGEEVWIANINCPKQVVISGGEKGLKAAGFLLKEEGARAIIPLSVHGAFHSRFMQSAAEALQPHLAQAPIQETEIELVMNATGTTESDPQQIIHYLAEQVVAPVLWEKCVRTLADLGVNRFIEIGPGSILSGLNRKIGVPGETISLGKVEHLELLEAKLSEAVG